MISIDIGTRNFNLVILKKQNDLVVKIVSWYRWDVRARTFPLVMKKLIPLLAAMFKRKRGRRRVLNLVESQGASKLLMKRVEAGLVGYFTGMDIPFKICQAAQRYKRFLSAEELKKMTYIQRKQASVRQCGLILSKEQPEFFRDQFEKLTKKDDFADAYLQGYYEIN